MKASTSLSSVQGHPREENWAAITQPVDYISLALAFEDAQIDLANLTYIVRNFAADKKGINHIRE